MHPAASLTPARLGAFLLLALACVLALAPRARAQFGTQFGEDTAHLVAALHADRKPIPAGSEAILALVIDVDQEWHIQSAVPFHPLLIPATLKIPPAEGLTVGPARWPVGKDIDIPPTAGFGAKASVYSGQITVLIPITVAKDAFPGERTIRMTLNSQACSDRDNNCVQPTNTVVSIKVDVASPETASVPRNAAIFAAAAGVPVYPPSATSAPGTSPAANSRPADTVGGVGGMSVKLLTDEEQLAEITKTAYAPAREEQYSLGLLIVFALVGGMILNIMPCVLPVIPLKVLSLVQQAHGDRRKSLMHALAFSAGIIALFVALGAVLKGLGFFYGEQFQSVGFLTAMSYIVLALALSMVGLWTINPPRVVYAAGRQHTGYAGSFSSGLLATLLATPCSAPYLGPVLAWALVQPMGVTMVGLALVGVGMALPYVILAVFPAALSKIPAAGRWSELLKQFLGIVMIGVAVFLITRIGDVTLWPWVFFGAVLVAAACWAWGQLPNLSMEPSRIWLIRAVVVIVSGAIGFGLFSYAQSATADTGDGEDWAPFNVALLREGLRQGRPVVIDWTADWCINCKVVERQVLNDKQVRDVFREKNVLLLRADLTSDNPPAKLLNRKLHGESIPVLAIFSPAHPTRPEILRDLYTRQSVIDAIRAAK